MPIKTFFFYNFNLRFNLSIFILVLVFCCKTLQAQENNNSIKKSNNNIIFSANVDKSVIMDYFFSHNHPNYISKNYTGIDIKVLKHFSDTNIYNHIYRNPNRGFGLHSSVTNNEFGQLISLYYSLEFPFHRYPIRNNTFGYTLNGGIAYINEPLKITNFDDRQLMSSKLNVYINFSLYYNYLIKKNFKSGIFLGFRHYSNALFKKPNVGLNLLSAGLNVSYMPHNTKIDDLTSYTVKKIDKYHRFNLLLGGGIRQIYENQDRFSTYNISAEWLYGFSYKYRSALGVNTGITLNGKVIEDDFEKTYNGLTSISLQAGWDWIITENIYLPFRFGYYLKRTEDLKEIKPYYEKVGFAYQFSDNFSSSISIKAHSFVAYMLEFGISANITTK